MIRWGSPSLDSQWRAPRASGDDPVGPRDVDNIALVLPARAGMILIYDEPARRDRCAPRASGDDPEASPVLPRICTCSPRERG